VPRRSRERKGTHDRLHGRVRLDDERVAQVGRLAALLGVDAVEAHRLRDRDASGKMHVQREER